MRCLIISGVRMRPEARELGLHALGAEITDWVEIPPQIGDIARYLRQADLVFVGGTSGVSEEVIAYLVENAHLPVVIVTPPYEEIQRIARGHGNVVLVPALAVVDTAINGLSARIMLAYYRAERALLPYAIAIEGEFEPYLLSSPIHLAGPIQPWITMGWRKGRLIVWRGFVWEILQDVVIPCGDYGSYSHRVLVCRRRPELYQAQPNPNLIEVFGEKWEL